MNESLGQMTMQADSVLIRELDKLFHRDPDIDELGIIFTAPSPSNVPDVTKNDDRARRPADPPEPKFILKEHKLGVSVHTIHPLINEAREALPEARAKYLGARRTRIGGNDDGSDGATAGPKEWSDEALKTAAARALSVTRALLLVNADHGSAWNLRKEIVRDGVYANVRREIKLLDLIFTKHAKSPNAWAHRRWCWRNDERFGRKQKDHWRPLSVHEELKMCQRVADLYPKNYYAWTQRSWVVLRVVGDAHGMGAEESSVMARARDLLQSEAIFLDQWLTTHVSDHSALNHRKNVISALTAVSSASGEPGLASVEDEQASNSTLIRDYPGHASLWCYRRFVCQAHLVITAPEALSALHPPSSSSDDRGTANGVQNVPLPTAACQSMVEDARARWGEAYDWPGWNRAVMQWYEGSLDEDARMQESADSQDDDDDLDPDDAREERSKYTEAVGDLDGIPRGGGILADFLGREARFALTCATDKGAWQFHQQRRHALAHLAFISYATDRILQHHHGAGPQGHTDRGAGNCVSTAHNGQGTRRSLKSCTAYCEVTGAAKLVFPLARDAEYDIAEDLKATNLTRRPLQPRGTSEGLRQLNAFVAGLALADGAAKAGNEYSGGVAPYRFQM